MDNNQENFQQNIKLDVKVLKKDKDGNIIGDDQND